MWECLSAGRQMKIVGLHSNDKYCSMIQHFLKTAWRSIFKNRLYSSINIVGLSAGLSGFIIVLLYLNYELSYDKWDPSLNKVYRVSVIDNGDVMWGTPTPLASFLAEKYPNTATACSFQPSGDYEALISCNNKKLYQKGLITTDSNFLQVIPYSMLTGDPNTVLNQPNAAIISEQLANTLFGKADPMGQPLGIGSFAKVIITGVFKEPAGPSHLNAQIIYRNPYEKSNMFWGNVSNQTYIKIKSPQSNQQIDEAINRLYYNERLKKDNLSYEAYVKAGHADALFTDAIPSIHNFPKHGSSNFTIVSVLLVLAILLLLAGAINFSNLDIAKSISRAKEVGVRKVLGSGRRQLVFQFMAETAIQCLLSLIIAILVVNLTLPYLNNSFNLSLGFWHQPNTGSIMFQIGICLILIVVLSGLYPSLLLSRFKTTSVLKGNFTNGNKRLGVRNGLIIVQFIVAAFFILSILVINGQMNYMQKKDKGFSGDQVMRIQPQLQQSRDDGFEQVRTALKGIPGVDYVSKTTMVPGDKELYDTSTEAFKYQGSEYRMSSVKISADYFKTLQIKLLNGRMLTDEPADQNTQNAIINQAAAEKLNIGDPIGKYIRFPECDSVPVQVVGVVNNFNVHGLETNIQPIVYTIGNKACMFQSGGAILVKLGSQQVQSSVADIQQAWKKIEPDFPLRYSFIDENFQELFKSYDRLQKIISLFGLVAVLISVMGLFALSAYFAKQKTREIGIRKVLGASVGSLALLMSRDFIRLVIVAVIISIPLAIWALDKWLQTFAYRISISWWMVLLAGLIVTAIAILTVSLQAIKAAVINPVKSLRSE